MKNSLLPTIDKSGQEEILLFYNFARCIRSEGDIVLSGNWSNNTRIAVCIGHVQAKKRGYVWILDPRHTIFHKSNIWFRQKLFDYHLETHIREIQGTSAYASKRWKRPIRLLCIDTKDYTSAASEVAYWTSWVVTGGIIVFRNGYCSYTGVWKAISLHVLSRRDIVDIGIVSSQLYVIVGRPTVKNSIQVAYKKLLLTCAHAIYTSIGRNQFTSFLLFSLLSVFLATSWNTRLFKDKTGLQLPL